MWGKEKYILVNPVLHFKYLITDYYFGVQKYPLFTKVAAVMLKKESTVHEVASSCSSVSFLTKARGSTSGLDYSVPLLVVWNHPLQYVF